MSSNTLPPPVDLTDLIEDLGSQKSVISSLIEQFNIDCPRYVRTLNEAICQKDGAKIEKTAHSMKSLLGIFQALQAYALAEEVEQRGRENKFEGIDALAVELNQEVERVQTYLARF
ncbi:HPt (histidine-containing phosphotransfer) domain-containing protein [Geoalkalibacter ferrihydriticus]|uniref:HPt domain-containing protein n=2 Tax=Geoalkalibacter ferrihydriticus TaxID=392333 RepID=A0A0C2HRC3_9BACT|nr:Hpt domain-containing protein [Geoalkalibacter ferrihydriticus]KIH77415.1 hypothetical protein GFER_01370 [Geoalkalibacter ferrihydriticus DSM 17813]SDM15987.1 HPt (histidine-containing phosphotransfer) domain-containing protein [Geoalkalibacter ferrihydriticus]